jgi:tetratricopeptide (TPR) repeat protein
LKACMAYDPHDYETLVYFGNAAEASGLLTLALSTYERALALNERPEIYARMAIVQFELGRPEEAQRNLSRASNFQIGYALLVADPVKTIVYDGAIARRERLRAQRGRGAP